MLITFTLEQEMQGHQNLCDKAAQLSNAEMERLVKILTHMQKDHPQLFTDLTNKARNDGYSIPAQRQSILEYLLTSSQASLFEKNKPINASLKMLLMAANNKIAVKHAQKNMTLVQQKSVPVFDSPALFSKPEKIPRIMSMPVLKLTERNAHAQSQKSSPLPCKRSIDELSSSTELTTTSNSSTYSSVVEYVLTRDSIGQGVELPCVSLNTSALFSNNFKKTYDNSYLSIPTSSEIFEPASLEQLREQFPIAYKDLLQLYLDENHELMSMTKQKCLNSGFIDNNYKITADFENEMLKMRRIVDEDLQALRIEAYVPN